MLKIDEMFIDPRVRWDGVDNRLYGSCYEHGENIDLTFNSYQKYQKELNVWHVPKETMTSALSSNSRSTNCCCTSNLLDERKLSCS